MKKIVGYTGITELVPDEKLREFMLLLKERFPHLAKKGKDTYYIRKYTEGRFDYLAFNVDDGQYSYVELGTEGNYTVLTYKSRSMAIHNLKNFMQQEAAILLESLERIDRVDVTPEELFGDLTQTKEQDQDLRDESTDNVKHTT